MHIKPSEIVAKQIAVFKSTSANSHSPTLTRDTSTHQSDNDIPSLVEEEEDTATIQIKVGNIYM